ncbi:MAG: VanZ family protein [Cellulosilyticaceae bacterium]
MKKYTLLFFVLLSLFLTFIIFTLSLQNSSTSSTFSKELTEQIIPIINRLTQSSSIEPISLSRLHYLLREFAHIIEFFILAFCMMITLHITRISSRYCILLTLIFTTIIAIVDELIQRYLSPGRAFQFIDIAKDLIGACLSIVIFMLIRWSILLICTKISSIFKR